MRCEPSCPSADEALRRPPRRCARRAGGPLAVFLRRVQALCWCAAGQAPALPPAPRGLSPRAQLSRRALYECRRGQLDARTRIRGQRYTDLLGKAQDAEE